MVRYLPLLQSTKVLVQFIILWRTSSLKPSYQSRPSLDPFRWPPWKENTKEKKTSGGQKKAKSKMKLDFSHFFIVGQPSQSWNHKLPTGIGIWASWARFWTVSGAGLAFSLSVYRTASNSTSPKLLTTLFMFKYLSATLYISWYLLPISCYISCINIL